MFWCQENYDLSTASHSTVSVHTPEQYLKAHCSNLMMQLFNQHVHIHKNRNKLKWTTYAQPSYSFCFAECFLVFVRAVVPLLLSHSKNKIIYENKAKSQCYNMPDSVHNETHK